jgi:autotransporter-associated beta strand protein
MRVLPTPSVGAAGSAVAGTEFHDSSTAGNAGFFNAGGRTFIRFSGNSTAASGDFFNGGSVSFSDASTAGNGTFSTNNGTVNCEPCAGSVSFFDTSTAGNGTFTYAGADTSDGTPAFTVFSDNSTADDGTFTCSPGQEGGEGSEVDFMQASTAANATLIANGGSNEDGGGSIQFFNDSSGGRARVKVFGNGFLDIGGHNAPGVSIGSIQGSGLVFLGALNLTVGSNNRSTTFSGLIQDGRVNGGTGGSLTKVGTGKLVLANANTYTAGTTIKRGTLMVNNRQGSGTGSGPLQINRGTLGGKGTIAGEVTVGTGSSSGAILSPGYEHGANKLGALTIESPLTFNADATYDVEVNSSSATADEVFANGIAINNGAQFSFGDVGGTVLPAGTVFTVIDNTAATPIDGTFSNLPDGSMFTVNGNTYQVNYEGGDGNDLTVRVVP